MPWMRPSIPDESPAAYRANRHHGHRRRRQPMRYHRPSHRLPWRPLRPTLSHLRLRQERSATPREYRPSMRRKPRNSSPPWMKPFNTLRHRNSHPRNGRNRSHDKPYISMNPRSPRCLRPLYSRQEPSRFHPSPSRHHRAWRSSTRLWPGHRQHDRNASPEAARNPTATPRRLLSPARSDVSG